MPAAQSRVALVLPGGAALGAYEAGVVDYIVRNLAVELGVEVRFDVLCGTSVGAVGATMLAAFADEPAAGADRLLGFWRGLRLERFLRPKVLGALASWCTGSSAQRGGRVGGLLNSRHIERLIIDSIPFERIGENLRRRHLSAVSVATTHVASGGTVVFIESSEPIADWSRDRTLAARPAVLRAEHLLASAAIPLLFPAVRIDGELFCEGGLRLNVPLSPALHLGASRLIVVSPHHVAPAEGKLGQAREHAVSGPLFLLGRMLNALLLDRIDADVERLEQINAILLAGARSFGPRFTSSLERQRPQGLPPLRLVDSLLVRASQSIGALARQFVRSARFRSRGFIGALLRQIAAAEGTVEADLVSYLLFDGDFASELIALGQSDARKEHDALCALLTSSEQLRVHRAGRVLQELSINR